MSDKIDFANEFPRLAKIIILIGSFVISAKFVAALALANGYTKDMPQTTFALLFSAVIILTILLNVILTLMFWTIYLFFCKNFLKMRVEQIKQIHTVHTFKRNSKKSGLKSYLRNLPLKLNSL